MKPKARCKLALAWLMAALLVATAMPGAARAGGSPVQKLPFVNAMGQTGLALPSVAVDQAVTSAVADQKQATFLVRMRRQPDLSALRSQGMARAQAQNMTPVSTKLAVREQVVLGMETLAEESQAGIRQQLQDLEQTGHVSKVQSFFIVNALAVTGDKAALDQLAKRVDVESINEDKHIYLDATSGELTNTPQPALTEPGDLTGVRPGSDGALSASPQPTDASQIGWDIQMLNAPAVWAEGYTGQGVVVASLDTGVDWTHPALQRKWRGYDPNNPNTPNPIYNWFDATGGSQAAPYDDVFHGTHTTATMVGSEANGNNQVGMAPGAQWIAAKFLGQQGGTADAALAAGQWLLAPTDASGHPHPEKAPDVINNSWGGGPGADDWFRNMVRAWRAANIFPAFANGNDGPADGTADNPGNYPESFASGAVDQNGNLADFSSRGPSPYGVIKPDVSAPGVNVRSAVPGGSYRAFSGTSMASPHTAGLVALMLSANSSLTVDRLSTLIMQTATPRTDSRYTTSPNNGYGSGIINALTAVAAVTGGIGTVSGHVVQSGDDFTPPTGSTTPVASGYTGLPIHIIAQAQDDVAVKEVKVLARIHGDAYWTCIDMARTAGDYHDGTYEADIPGNLVVPPATDYEVRIEDFGGNVTYLPADPSQPYQIAVTNGVTPGYLQDFETNIDGWMHGGQNDSWQWGVPTSGPGNAHSGTKVMATNLSGNYPDNSNAWLLMPPVDLTQTQRAALSFWQWYQFEQNYDHGTVWVSTDLQHWTQLLSETGTNGNSWQNQIIDLSAYAGQRIFILFNLDSDSSVNFPGWYLDDVAILGPSSQPPAAPTGLSGTADGLGQAHLSWSASVTPGVTSYKIYRSASQNQGYALVGSAPATTFLDGNPPTGATAYYQVTAVDLWGNEGQPSNPVGVNIPQVQVLLSDDFESQDDHGWTHSGANDVWAHGTPTKGPNGAHSGTRLWATDLHNAYPNNMDAALYSPSIDLTHVAHASLTFASWYQFEQCCDSARLEISTDGQNWTQLGRWAGQSQGWETPAIDLTPYVGHQAQIRFRAVSDYSVTFAGWFVDDVRVVGSASGSGASQSTPEGANTKSGKAPVVKPQLKQRLFSLASGSAHWSTARVQAEAQSHKSQESSGATQGKIGIQSLPITGATVTVLEIGNSVPVDPATGMYAIQLPTGTFTLRAEAYGFFHQDQTVQVTNNGTTTANFVLQPIPRHHITGTVTNSRTNSPISGATVMVMEDSHISPVATDSQGHYDLNVLQGSYTVRASAPGYYPTTVTADASQGDVTANVALHPFVGIPGDLAYDDGTPETGWAFNHGGAMWGERFTPTSATALVAGASFLFWDASWPQPGGTDFEYAVFDATGSSGSPGRMLAGPFHGTATRDGHTWTDLDLSSLGIVVSGDFYIALIQTADYPNVPGIASDMDSTNAHRTWYNPGDSWQPAPDQIGNLMIRAHVLNPVNAPVITSPSQNPYYTNNATLNLAGQSVAGAQITLYDNGNQAGTLTADGNGRFAGAVSLQTGQNVITATATVATGTTDPSAPLTVIYTNQPPTVSLSSPVDNMYTNQQAVTVAGSAVSPYLATVTVNGQSVQVANDGSFSTRTLVNQGDNTITVVATDSAGNATTVTRTVHVNWTAPAINNLMPNHDVNLTAGQSVTVSFDSTPGLTASFDIALPGSSSGSGTQAITTQVHIESTGNLTETPAGSGHYVGTWTAPQNTQFHGASVVVHALDAYGNRADATATGHVSVGSSSGQGAAHARISRVFSPLPAHFPIMFNGMGSSSDGGSIVQWSWDFGDGSQATGRMVRHAFAQSGTYTVRLTVTDSHGNTDAASVSVRIR